MVPVKIVQQDEFLAHALAGVGVTPEGEQFAVFNLVGESGVMVQFGQDPRFRYKVMMKDCIAAIKDFHEEYRDELLTLADTGGGEGAPGGAPTPPGPVDAIKHSGAEGRAAGE
jgi:hypothetical protein